MALQRDKSLHEPASPSFEPNTASSMKRPVTSSQEETSEEGSSEDTSSMSDSSDTASSSSSDSEEDSDEDSDDDSDDDSSSGSDIPRNKKRTSATVITKTEHNKKLPEKLPEKSASGARTVPKTTEVKTIKSEGFPRDPKDIIADTQELAGGAKGTRDAPPAGDKKTNASPGIIESKAFSHGKTTTGGSEVSVPKEITMVEFSKSKDLKRKHSTTKSGKKVDAGSDTLVFGTPSPNFIGTESKKVKLGHAPISALKLKSIAHEKTTSNRPQPLSTAHPPSPEVSSPISERHSQLRDKLTKLEAQVQKLQMEKNALKIAAANVMFYVSVLAKVGDVGKLGVRIKELEEALHM